MISIFRTILLTLPLIIPTIVSQSLETPTVTIDSGPLIGRTTQLPDSNASVNQFLGLPFAKAPLNSLRFSPPEMPESWVDAYDATSQPMACLQYMGREGPARDLGQALFNTPPPPGESEDCLYLNVFAPGGGIADRPVLFWIHGGSGTAGAASQPIYDGTSFAANQDIVVVAANYRLNVFGTPRAPQLPSEQRNPGVLDQRLALDWVQRNIRAFGGDPEKVTIMGESAGAMGVGHLINTYPDNPPFRAGVLQSGSSVVKLPPPPNNNDTTVWTTLVELLNCTGTSDEDILSCVREVPAETLRDITEANGIVFSEPIRDNVTVLELPAEAFAHGNVARVPILIGSTADDGSVFALEPVDSVTEFIEASFGAGSEISQLLGSIYAQGSPATIGLTTAQEIVSQIVTDVTFRCTSGFVANLTSTLLDMPVWQYVFNASVPSNQREDEYPGLGIYHASEIPLQFGTYPRENSTEIEARLSQSMQKQFADFVKDPMQGPGWSQWPAVGILGINETDAVTTTRDVRELDAVCAIWDELYILAIAGAEGSLADTADATDESSASTTSTASDSSGTGSSDTSANAAYRISTGSFGSGIIGAGLLGFAVIL